MEAIILVVTTIDFAYKKPLTKVVYAGSDVNKAYSVYNTNTQNDGRVQVNLDLTQGEIVKRLETHHCED